MKVCIYGAGAIGGMLGVGLARAGVDLSLIARGPHLQAMRDRGLALRMGGETHVVKPTLTDDPARLGPQDFVIVTLKAQSVAAVAQAMQPLLGPQTAVVMAVNGVPWWYFHRLPGPFENRRLASVDPDGRLWDLIGPERAIGCVVYPAAEITEPGVVEHGDGDRFTLGEPDGTRSERAGRLAQAIISGGFKAPVRPRIRDEIWVKLWGNVAFNPISALTHGTLKRICEDPGTRALARAAMVEAKTIAEALGTKFAIDVDQRIDGAAAVGEHKTSMLQDLERGRSMEIDPIVGAVAELGDITGIDTPVIDGLLALVRQRARVAGCYGA